MTCRDNELAKDNLISNLLEFEIPHNIVNYKYLKIEKEEMRAFLLFILIFEVFVGGLLKGDFEKLKEKDLKDRVASFIKDN